MTMATEIVSATLQVAGKERWVETKTHISGGGGYMHRGTGFVHPVHIVQESEVHDQLYLMDPNGNLLDVQLTNWNIGCMDGHYLTLVWEKSRTVDQKEGCLHVSVTDINPMSPYLAIKNRNTGKAIYNEKFIRSLSRNPVYFVVPIVFVAAYFVTTSLLSVKVNFFYYICFILLGLVAWMKTWNPQKYKSVKAEIDSHLNRSN